MSSAPPPQENCVKNSSPRPSVTICLSGGGFRAALFHLGALRRLNELGVLSQVTLFSSVSGGSILAAHLATSVREWPSSGEVISKWSHVEQEFLKIVKTNVRTGPIFRRLLLPWNWFRSSTQVKALENKYFDKLTRLRISDLPIRPEFEFCSTDMINGVLWKFGREKTGSKGAGYFETPAEWNLAKAVAASSCFPPIFAPMPLFLKDAKLIRPGCNDSWKTMCVCDGGLYDNLGLDLALGIDEEDDEQEDDQSCLLSEKRLTASDAVFVSDGGAPFHPFVPRGAFGRGKAYLAILGRQAVAVRKHWFLEQREDEKFKGAYWGIGSAVHNYPQHDEIGYSKKIAKHSIAKIRTDLDVFSDAEIAVLCNHGYLLADVAIKSHADWAIKDAKKEIPYPEWMDEEKVWHALRRSRRSTLLGHFR